MEAFVGLQPALNTRMLVGRVVIADQINLLAGRDRLIDHAQKLQPFLMAVHLLAQAEYFAVGGV